VVRVNGQPWVTRQATGNGFSLALDAAPLLLDLPKTLPTLGIDPSTATGFTVHVNREGGACQDGKQEVLNTPFTLFEVQVNFPETVVQTDSGQAHSCTVNTQGGVRCKGRNFEGQLGNGSFVGSATPVQVVGLSSGVQAVSVGGLHSCAILAGGVVKCWGNNSSGELGDGGTTRRATPVAVNGLGGGVRAIDLGSAFTCALTQGGGVQCWGVNNFGQLGSVTPDALKSLTPVGVEGLGSAVAAIAAGPLHACALTTEGTVKCWGFNGVGLLGNASVQQSATPLLVAGLRPGVTSISVSASASNVETCAAFGTGVRQCWGTRSAVPVDTP
jgi:alpha-tubulin suppressor-like RCC1 family protein